jgi:hypothetical protein
MYSKFEKIEFFFSVVKFHKNLVNTLDPDPHLPKMLFRIRNETKTDPQQ